MKPLLNPFGDRLITADEPKGLCIYTKNRIFEQTFKGYLAEIAGIDFRWIEAKLGIAALEGCAVIPLKKFLKPDKARSV